jgi:hypothetical protein
VFEVVVAGGWEDAPPLPEEPTDSKPNSCCAAAGLDLDDGELDFEEPVFFLVVAWRWAGVGVGVEVATAMVRGFADGAEPVVADECVRRGAGLRLEACCSRLTTGGSGSSAVVMQ